MNLMINLSKCQMWYRCAICDRSSVFASVHNILCPPIDGDLELLFQNIYTPQLFHSRWSMPNTNFTFFMSQQFLGSWSMTRPIIT